MQRQDQRTLVVCIGNELVADDAIGHEVFQRLLGTQARLVYLGVGGIDILALLEGESHLIVVDAVELGSAPGTVHVIPWESLPAGGAAVSAHGLGVREAVEIGRLLYPEKMPERVTVVGIEGRCFNRMREFMTREVYLAADQAVAAVREMVAGGCR